MHELMLSSSLSFSRADEFALKKNLGSADTRDGKGKGGKRDELEVIDFEASFVTFLASITNEIENLRSSINGGDNSDNKLGDGNGDGEERYSPTRIAHNESITQNLLSSVQKLSNIFNTIRDSRKRLNWASQSPIFSIEISQLVPMSFVAISTALTLSIMTATA